MVTLVGKVAGVQFSSTSGRLGSGQTLTVRGTGSMYAGNSPLYVVDGVPYEGDINNINAADIESMTILKDAASNALYGARGANGVIMITTKKAKVGEAVVTFDGKWGVNTKALQTYDVTETAGEFYEMHHAALMNYQTLNLGKTEADAYAWASKQILTSGEGGLNYNVMTFPEGENLIGSNGKLNPNATEGRKVTYNGQEYWVQPDNWLDEIYKSATFRQEYNVNIAAAADRANFYASLGYLDNTGIVDGSDMERYTARLRADYQAKEWLKVGGNFSYTHFVWNNGNNPDNEGASDGGNAFADAMLTAPIYPLYIRDGEGNIMTDEHGFKIYDIGDGRNAGMTRRQGGTSNTLQDIQLNINRNEGNAFTGGGFADIDLYDGLKLTVNANVTIDETRSTEVLNAFYGQFATSGGVVSKSHSRMIAYNLQQLLNYTKSFGSHNINLLLGHEMYNRKSYGLGASRSGMFSPDNTELSGAVTDMSSSSSSVSEYNNEGYFFRAMYDFNEKYHFSASFRRDASSMFHPDNRWGNFWSVGAAWIIDRENWFNVDWVNMLKVKASYGSQGNDNLPYYYLYTDVYDIMNDGAGGVTNTLARKGNKDITWETNTNLNIGVEFGLWNDRLYGNVDFFNRLTSDMLFQMSVPTEAGYTSIWTNIGDMRNRGIEIELGGDIIRKKDFVWSVNLNMTHYKNEIVELPEQYKNTTSADGKRVGRYSGNKFLSEGTSLYEFYMPTFAGVNDKGESTWYYYRDEVVKDAEGKPVQKVENGEPVFEEDGKTPVYEMTKVRDITDNYGTAEANGMEFHGDALPDLYGGFGTTLQWKGLDFSAQFTYQLGGLTYDSGYARYMASPGSTEDGVPYHMDLLNAWTPENSTSNIPRFSLDDNYSNAQSNRFLTDASYLNIQNITLGYTLPQKWTKKFLVNKLRVYVSCDNVWYWSKRQGLDPRQSISGGTNPFYYAPIRTFSGGVSVTF